MAQYALAAAEGTSAATGLIGAIGEIILGAERNRIAHRQLDLASEYSQQQIKFQERQQQFAEHMALNGFNIRHQQLTSLGYSQLDARRIMGSGEGVTYGGQYVPPMTHFGGFTTQAPRAGRGVTVLNTYPSRGGPKGTPPLSNQPPKQNSKPGVWVQPNPQSSTV